MTSLRLVFMGTPDFSVPTLEALVSNGHEVVAAYSQPPRPAGRGQALRKSPVHEAAERLGIPVHTPSSIKPQAEVDAFSALNADAAVVIAYGLILPKAILEAPRLGCINLHASLLPRWRGAAPIQRAIEAGDSTTGVTVMQMDEGLDTGDMLLRREVRITDSTTGGALHDSLSALSAELICPALEGLAAGTIVPEPQPREGVTYAAKLDKAEARLDFSGDAAHLTHKIMAFSPWPGCWFELAGQRIKVLAAVHEPGLSGKAGTVLDNRMTIACGSGGAVRPTEIQPAGGKRMKVDEFVRGRGEVANNSVG